jgi:hypothetical protein
MKCARGGCAASQPSAQYTKQKHLFLRFGRESARGTLMHQIDLLLPTQLQPRKFSSRHLRLGESILFSRTKHQSLFMPIKRAKKFILGLIKK